MNDFNFKKAEDIEEPECFYIYLKEEVKVLALRPGTLMLESQLRFSNRWIGEGGMARVPPLAMPLCRLMAILVFLNSFHPNFV